MLKPVGITSQSWGPERPADPCEQLGFESLARLPSKLPEKMVKVVHAIP